MRFVPTTIAGVTFLEVDAVEDERGYFGRTFCEKELAAAGIAMQVKQINISHNRRAFTLRGLHYQSAPFEEPKIVQCVKGRIWDVAVDLRPASHTYKRWEAVELSPSSKRLFHIPAGCAHGFITLEDDTDIAYLMGAVYVPAASRGVRWDDPAFGIRWPASPVEISERDAGYPNLSEANPHEAC